jgi:sporulation integral membrane protein YtvI
VKKLLAFYKKFGKTFVDWGLIIATGLIICFLFTQIYRYASPILFSLIFYILIHPLADFLHKKGMNKALSTGISTTLLLAIVVGAIKLFGSIIATQINNLTHAIPNYLTMFEKDIVEKVDYYEKKLNHTLPPEVASKIKEYATEIIQKTGNITNSLLSGTVSLFTSSITLVFKLLFGLILALFLCIDTETMKTFGNKKLPKTLKNVLFFIKEHVIKGITKYLIAQFKIVGFTFTFIFIGLLILRVDNAFTVSLISGLLDLLPIIGIPALFIPWIIYLFMVGNTIKAIALATLLLIVVSFRHTAEPKIMGDSFGVPAYVMLSGLVVATSMLGVIGIIASPIMIIVIKALYDDGYFRKWVRYPDGEYDN